jgi:hypothetical protein
MTATVAEYVYGIVGESMKAPAVRGIAGAPIRLIAGNGAAALVSDLEPDKLGLGREEVLAHARVLEEALSQGTVLPMRFGIVMESPDEVRDRLLDRHAPRLRAQLDELAGKVEINIRALYEEEPVMREIVREDPEVASLRRALRDESEDATYYARIRLGELVAAALERKRQVDAQTLLEALRAFSLAVEVGEPNHERVVLSASFLVERSRLADFDDVLDGLADAQAGRMRFKYTGPLPPHSFVDLTQDT